LKVDYNISFHKMPFTLSNHYSEIKSLGSAIGRANDPSLKAQYKEKLADLNRRVKELKAKAPGHFEGAALQWQREVQQALDAICFMVDLMCGRLAPCAILMMHFNIKHSIIKHLLLEVWATAKLQMEKEMEQLEKTFKLFHAELQSLSILT
jgi:hypothetical protein